jgi:hypothetical protein
MITRAEKEREGGKGINKIETESSRFNCDHLKCGIYLSRIGIMRQREASMMNDHVTPL